MAEFCLGVDGLCFGLEESGGAMAESCLGVAMFYFRLAQVWVGPAGHCYALAADCLGATQNRWAAKAGCFLAAEFGFAAAEFGSVRAGVSD